MQACGIITTPAGAYLEQRRCRHGHWGVGRHQQRAAGHWAVGHGHDTPACQQLLLLHEYVAAAELLVGRRLQGARLAAGWACGVAQGPPYWLA